MGNRYSVSASYNNEKLRMFTSNYCAYQELKESGTIGKTGNSTWLMLGTDPKGSESEQNYLFNGTIHSVRVYSKALSDEERAVNYANDKERYKI